MTINITDVATRMGLALKDVVGADLPLVRGYADAKAQAVVQYADLIATAYAAGALDDAQMKAEFEEIEHMTRRYARTMRGLTGVAAERAAQAALGVLFDAVRTGLALSGAPLPVAFLTPLD